MKNTISKIGSIKKVLIKEQISFSWKHVGKVIFIDNTVKECYYRKQNKIIGNCEIH